MECNPMELPVIMKMAIMETKIPEVNGNDFRRPDARTSVDKMTPAIRVRD